MEKQFKADIILKAVNGSRRDFIKKVVVGTAFAVPVINSFSMDGLKIRMGIGQAGADERGGFDAPGAEQKAGVVAPGRVTPGPRPVPSPVK